MSGTSPLEELASGVLASRETIVAGSARVGAAEGYVQELQAWASEKGIGGKNGFLFVASQAALDRAAEATTALAAANEAMEQLGKALKDLGA